MDRCRYPMRSATVLLGWLACGMPAAGADVPASGSIRYEECSSGIKDKVKGPLGQMLDDFLALPCNVFKSLPTHADPEPAPPQRNPAAQAPPAITFEARISPDVVRPGQLITVVSQVELPKTPAKPDIRIELVLLDPAGEELARVSKAPSSADATPRAAR